MFNLFKPKVRPVIQKLAEELPKTPSWSGFGWINYYVSGEKITLYKNKVLYSECRLRLNSEEQKLLKPFMKFEGPNKKSPEQKLMELLSE